MAESRTPRAASPVDPPAPPSAPPRATPPLQFSMRSLLIVMTVAAVLAAILPHSGVPVVTLLCGVLLLFVLPVCLGTLALYCRGHRQTFFLGALVGGLAPYLLGASQVLAGGAIAWTAWLLLQAFACVACGFAALGTRRFLESRGWDDPAGGGPKNL